MRYYEVGIVYGYYADDEEHAIEQFVDALGFTEDELEADHLRSSINVIEELYDEDDE